MASSFFDIFNVYVLLASALALLWYYLQSTYNYWRRLNVKFLKPIPFFGNTASYLLQRKNFVESLDQLYKELHDEPYGGYYELSEPVLLVKDPDLVSSILIADFRNFHDRSKSILLNRNRKVNPMQENLFLIEGERWRTQRKKMRPFYSPAKLKLMCDQMFYCVDLLIECIDTQMNETGSVDMAIEPLMDRLTIDVIGTCAFGIECHSLKSNDEFVRMCYEISKPMSYSIVRRLAVSIFGKRLNHLLNWRITKKEVGDFFMNLVLTTMQYRRENNVVRNDLLQLFMSLQNSYVDQKFTGERENAEVSPDEKFDEIDIAANTFMSFFAGYGTTSATLSYCLYEIALNEDIQRRLYSEIKQIHDKYKTIRYDFFKEMHYLDAVISETLRKYPISPCLYRKCTSDFMIPNTKVCIPAGVKTIIPTWSIHHDERIYPNPEVFDPNRFMNDQESSRSRGVYLPFGDGPRQCIGKHFSETEMKAALSIMILKYNLKPCSKTEIPLTFKKGTNALLPQHGIWLNISKRKIPEYLLL